LQPSVEARRVFCAVTWHLSCQHDLALRAPSIAGLLEAHVPCHIVGSPVRKLWGPQT